MHQPVPLFLSLHMSQALQDWKLFLVLAAFLLFDVFLLTVSSAVAQTRLNAQFSYVSYGGYSQALHTQANSTIHGLTYQI